jgi:hypothetical protein
MKLSQAKKRKLTKHLTDRKVKQMLGGAGSGGSAPVGGRKGGMATGTYAAAAVKKSPALQKLKSQKNDPSRSPEMFKQQLKKVAQQAAKKGQPKTAAKSMMQELKNKMAQKEKKPAQLVKKANMQAQKLLQKEKQMKKQLAQGAKKFVDATPAARKASVQRMKQSMKKKAAQLKKEKAVAAATAAIAKREEGKAMATKSKLQQMKNDPDLLNKLV